MTRGPQGGSNGTHGPLPAELYTELRAVVRGVVRGKRCPGLLQTTALVHEAWLRLASQGESAATPNEDQLAAFAARAIRSALIDEARREGRQKRGGTWRRIPLLDESVGTGKGGRMIDFLELDAALSELAALHSRRADVVELRYFGGMTVEAVASVLGVSRRTVESDWEQARAWLRVRLMQKLQGEESEA